MFLLVFVLMCWYGVTLSMLFAPLINFTSSLVAPSSIIFENLLCLRKYGSSPNHLIE